MRKKSKVTIPLKDSYVKKLTSACESDMEKRVIRVFLETGMHPEVMAKPKAHDLEIVRGYLTWERPKTFKLCQWEYPDDLEDLVQEFMKHDLSYHRATYWRLVKRVSERANLKYVSPLTLRHTCTIVLLKTKGPEEAMRILQCSPRTLWGTYGRL